MTRSLRLIAAAGVLVLAAHLIAAQTRESVPAPPRSAQPGAGLLIDGGSPGFRASYYRLAAVASQLGYKADLGRIHSVTQLREYRGFVTRGPLRLQEIEFLQRFIEDGGRALLWVDRLTLPPHGERIGQEPPSAVSADLALLRTLYTGTWFNLPVLLEDIEAPASTLSDVPLWHGYKLSVKDDASFHAYLVPGNEYRVLCAVKHPTGGQQRVLAASRSFGSGDVMFVSLPEDRRARPTDPFDDTNFGLQDNGKAAMAMLQWLAGDR
jgi:hypothetical protein